MRVKLIGVSDKTRKSESVTRAKYGLLFSNQRKFPIVDVKFLRSNLPWSFGRVVREVGALRRHMEPMGYAALPADRAIWYAAISISFHFVLRERSEVDRACITSYRFVP